MTTMDPRPAMAMAALSIDEADIERLVHRFYGRVRRDDVLGPIFEAEVADWPEHLRNLTDFWSSVVLRTARYRGRPMAPHLRLGLKPDHFDRWLDLFEDTASTELPDRAAALFVDRARRIADSFEMAIASIDGRLHEPRHLKRG